jgi:signal transduction histidine kinase
MASDPSTTHLNGNGIGFLHKRAQALGGKFEFRSGIGNGTTALLVVGYSLETVLVLTT